MKPTAEMRAAALKASYDLREKGNRTRNQKPISFTADPHAHVDVILEAALALIPEPKPTRKRKHG